MPLAFLPLASLPDAGPPAHSPDEPRTARRGRDAAADDADDAATPCRPTGGGAGGARRRVLSAGLLDELASLSQQAEDLLAAPGLLVATGAGEGATSDGYGE